MASISYIPLAFNISNNESNAYDESDNLSVCGNFEGKISIKIK